MNTNDLNISVLESFIERGINLLPQLVLAIVILVLGLKVIKMLKNRIDYYFTKRELDPALQNFLLNLLDITLKIALFISIASTIGIQTTSFVAVLGSAGLAVGLALQGSLANFAGGVMLLLFRPFKAGHFIEAQGFLGTVKNLTIFHTILVTSDNKRIILPNGPLANSPITNYSAEPTRRVDLLFSISYSDDINKAKDVIFEIISNDPRALSEPAPFVGVLTLGESSVDLSSRTWVNAKDYWPFYWENIEKIKIALEKEGMSIPFPQRDVHLYQK